MGSVPEFTSLFLPNLHQHAIIPTRTSFPSQLQFCRMMILAQICKQSRRSRSLLWSRIVAPSVIKATERFREDGHKRQRNRSVVTKNKRYRTARGLLYSKLCDSQLLLQSSSFVEPGSLLDFRNFRSSCKCEWKISIRQKNVLLRGICSPLFHLSLVSSFIYCHGQIVVFLFFGLWPLYKGKFSEGNQPNKSTVE